ncbi:STAS domain-containing protein [Methylomonas montana]|uniref:STAS domain-containing protein n=1 Tax=Methylomonas montana TaxID=3058963 RepID=UPI00265AFCB2|nr:STAS domain-containing protein [Methylomonas montana]WKJ92455.1 STAS domain-containing protein [Methylomonas montana]
MAEKDENSLIGYDPLAWMLKASDQRSEPVAESDGSEYRETQEFVGLIDTLAIIPETANFQTPPQATDGTLAENAEKAVLVLEPVLNIQNVTVLHQQLMQMLNHHDAIDIDASAVTMIDTSSLQLLLVLKQAAVSLQKSISIDFPSDRFIEAAELLGIAEMLEVDQAASGFF